MATMVEKKYGMLRTISIILKILAVLTLVLRVIAGLGAIAGSETVGQMSGDSHQKEVTAGMLGGGFASIVTGIIAAIALWAWAELIKLLIDVEENTRKTHILLERDRS